MDSSSSVASTQCSDCESTGPVTSSTRPITNTSTVTMWNLHICPTTGGQFQVEMSNKESVDGLKKIVGKRLKIAKDRICLLCRNRLLKEGSLQDNGLSDGSRITLLPSVETGLMTQKPEDTVMQALENLSEPQVTDFLSGKSPLTLGMRLGDHMMFVQLQLSTSHVASKKAKLIKKTPIQRTPLSRLSTSSTSSSPSSSASSAPSSPTTTAQQPKTHSAPSLSSTMTSRPAHTVIGRMPTSIPGRHDSSVVEKDSRERAQQPLIDNSALAQAKRSLSQKVKEFSKVSASHIKECAEAVAYKPRGAVIETMHHIGQGVYSGTFSGTLNPALQDRDGKPRRNINTIIHILNDLLGASPQYRSRAESKASDRHQRHTACGSSTTHDDSNSLNQENRALRGKVEHLQQMLEERRQRRRARRETRSMPYPKVVANECDQAPMDIIDTDSTMISESALGDNGGYIELKPDQDQEVGPGAVVA